MRIATMSVAFRRMSSAAHIERDTAGGRERLTPKGTLLPRSGSRLGTGFDWGGRTPC
jgi:hypothetical protein